MPASAMKAPETATSSTLNQQRQLNEQLQHAPEHRLVIEQARASPPARNSLPWMGSSDEEHTPQSFFRGFPNGLALFNAVQAAVEEVGASDLRVTTSQIAFRRGRGFAYVWRPGQYVNSEIPAVLSIALPRKVSSNRFKSVAHPSTRVWMHHIELSDSSQIDDEVRSWLAEAYESAC
jgi:hypothetical protein